MVFMSGHRGMPLNPAVFQFIEYVGACMCIDQLCECVIC